MIPRVRRLALTNLSAVFTCIPFACEMASSSRSDSAVSPPPESMSLTRKLQRVVTWLSTTTAGSRNDVHVEFHGQYARVATAVGGIHAVVHPSRCVIFKSGESDGGQRVFPNLSSAKLHLTTPTPR